MKGELSPLSPLNSRVLTDRMLNVLLLAVPVAIGLEILSPGQHLAIFIASALGVVALAAWLGRATEQLCAHTGDAVGGLLNATLGNAAELIIAIVALRAGMVEVVRASLTGSIIGNLLLIVGASFLAGGAKHSTQKFNAKAAGTQSGMLTLAAIALIMPAVFHHTGGTDLLSREHGVSFAIAIVLILCYIAGLFFSLRTHKTLFAGGDHTAHGDSKPWSIRKAVAVLLVVTALIAWMSEILVGAVEPAAHAMGLNNLFVGVFVVAIVGNAAEHSSAILFAMKNRMDLALGIAMGSSTQVALFVAPVLVLLSYVIAPAPLDFVFSPMEVMAIFCSVIIAEQVSKDGESNWFEGVQLLAVYAVLGIAFYYLP